MEDALTMQVTILFSIEYKDSVFHFSGQVRKTRRPIQKGELQFPQRFPQRVGYPS